VMTFSYGHNLADDNSCGLTAQGDQPGTEPLLRALRLRWPDEDLGAASVKPCGRRWIHLLPPRPYRRPARASPQRELPWRADGRRRR
jgi:hypothetical protein